MILKAFDDFLFPLFFFYFYTQKNIIYMFCLEYKIFSILRILFTNNFYSYFIKNFLKFFKRVLFSEFFEYVQILYVLH